MNHRRRGSRIGPVIQLIAGVCILMVALPASAQVIRLAPIIRPATVPVAAPGSEVAPESPVESSGVAVSTTVLVPSTIGELVGTNAVAKPSSPEDQRLQDLLKLKFDRSTPAILEALAGQFDGKSATNEVERFSQRVVVGDWAEVGTFLRDLPADHGKQVYRHLLKELPNTTRPSGPSAGGAQPGPPPPNQPGPGRTGGPTLVFEDVLALAEQAPHELETEDTRLLGLLVGRLLTRGDALEPLLARLETGVKGLGGKDPSDRRRAAEILVAANRLIEAGPFLLPVQPAQDSQDWTALDLRARQLIAVGTKEKDTKALAQAWELNQFILAATNSPATNREAALRRSFELIPQISREVGTNWLRRSFAESPGQGLVILSAVSQMVQQGFNNRATSQRQSNLELQKQVVETFLTVTDPAQPHWRAALNLLAQGWMQEATYSQQRFQPRRTSGPQYDPFGNIISFAPYQPPMQDGGQFPALPVEQVITSAPDEQWFAQLDESLRLALFALITDLHLKADAPDKALPYLEAFATQQPRAATDLANEFLRAWARVRNPVQSRGPIYSPYMSMSYAMRSSGGIPLTRAMQARNIRELGGLLQRLQALKLPNLDDDAVVGAFSAAHSPAEVFRTEDIAAVFGPHEAVKLETLAGLAQTMRERLASQWRQPRVQTELKTQRTDRQIEAEMLRGYEVVMELIASGLKRQPDHWQLHLAQAAANFDLAEYQYGKQVDLSIYVQKRDEAFEGFARAAALYAAAVPAIEEAEQSPKVFQQWFNASLGASDLAYVTRQQEPDTNQLQRIQSAIHALPGAAAEKHLAAFAKSLGQSANMLKSELKPRYLRAGLHITGDHPEAEEARKLATYYDDLLQELEFIVRLDGDATVGHGRPFGLFVSLHHTADVEREAGGFGRYLRNLKRSSTMYYSPYAQQQRNFVEDFDRQVREKLADKFEVKSVTFLDEKVQSRGSGRVGWRETPLAYVLLQAKDASADQIPVLHMDLDFADQRGQVVLPVESPITLLDARPERVAARPVTELEVTQILDERDLPQGLVTLEIKATARGLVPELSTILRTNFPNFQIEEFSDHGLAVLQIDTEGDDLAPLSERNWLIKLRVDENAPRSLAFHFGEAALPGAKLVFKRYEDADLVEVTPTLALAGLTLRARPLWHWLLLTLVILGAAAGLTWWLRQRRPEAAQAASPYLLPEAATPFTVIGLLRRMQADASLPWPEAHRTELAQTIRKLEAHFFARERNGDPSPDLTDIGRRWVELAGNGK
ncbi:MAG: hypothetical protein IH623_15890 [Verrucomicrobia bacterium]|nr:hypothetical protein [Verrucomicrobiota bacterium]